MLLVELQNGAATLENCLAVPQKVNREPHITEQFHSEVHTQENGEHVYTKTCTGVFTAALFLLTKKRKQSKRPSR